MSATHSLEHTAPCRHCMPPASQGAMSAPRLPGYTPIRLCIWCIRVWLHQGGAQCSDLSTNFVSSQGGASILSAALDAAAAAAAQDGHVIPPAAAAGPAVLLPHPRRDTRQLPRPAAATGAAAASTDPDGPEAGPAPGPDGGGAGLLRPAAAGTAQLVARAMRLGPKPAADSLPGGTSQQLSVHALGRQSL
jgi:hypothetical protein